MHEGLIDRQGRVLCMKLFGDDGKQEDNGPAPRKKKPRKKKD